MSQTFPFRKRALQFGNAVTCYVNPGNLPSYGSQMKIHNDLRRNFRASPEPLKSEEGL
jgi:hypothetical protein